MTGSEAAAYAVLQTAYAASTRTGSGCLRPLPWCPMATPPHPPSSFDEFVRRWRSDLLAAARKLLGDSDLTEDVVQTVLLKLLTSGDWQRIEAPEAYFRSAVYREALRALDFRRRSVPLAEVRYTLRSTADGPFHHAVIMEQSGLLRAHLESLPERCGVVMTLKLMSDLSHAEIASFLEISRGAVDKQVARGKERLRERLRIGPEGEIKWCPHSRTGGASRFEGL